MIKTGLFFLVSLLFVVSHAHEHGHEQSHEELKSGPVASDLSLYQLDSKWIDQDGNSIALSKFSGQPRILAMVYTRCQTACPLLVDDIQQLLKSLGKDKLKSPVTLVSFDSKHESPATMKEFIKKRKLDSDWTILKGDASAVTELAAVLGVRYKELKSGEYIHSNSLFFLNEKGEIAATREGLNTSNESFKRIISKALNK